ncbi:hypothetical protein BDW69DRAFT_176375 [Aspergillus filifer]
MFHVTGDVIAASGMRYGEKEDECPATSEYLHAYNAIVFVRKSDYHSGRISEILSGLPRPTKRQGINLWEVDSVTKRHEVIWTRADGEKYKEGSSGGRTLSVMSGRMILLFLR